MTALKKQIVGYIEVMPDSKLKALKPLLEVLMGDDFVIETDLTPEEHAIIDASHAKYKDSDFISFRSN